MIVLARLKQLFRWLDGASAYARYCAHMEARHPGQAPLSRKAFFRAEQERKWQGINRCC